jgi:hypothetical protein
MTKHRNDQGINPPTQIAETLPSFDPYNGKSPALGRVNASQEPFASCQIIQQDTSNIRKANQYL